LFILYISGICELNTGGSIITYADAPCLFFSDKYWEMVKEKTTIGLNRVFHELNNRKLTLNIKKTYFKVFSSNNTLITANDIVISYTYL